VRRATVVVADRHNEIRTVFREFFASSQHYRMVGEASNGVEVVDVVDRLKPDFVVLDSELPRRNGIEVTRIIKQRRASTRVIIATLFDDPLYKARALQAHADAFLVKSSLKGSLESVFGVGLGEKKRRPRSAAPRSR